MENPVDWFWRWYREAEKTEPRVPDAMQIATVDADGRPWVRTVLMKGLDERGIVFYTNYNSRKSMHLEQNPKVSVCFHWKDLARQVIASGRVVLLTNAESDAYFASRSRGSRLGAWASDQSATISSRAALMKQVESVTERFENQEVPRPEFWGGFRIVVDYWEFWQDRDDRLHDRIIYRKADEDWVLERLQP